MLSIKSLCTITAVLLPWISGVYLQDYIPLSSTTQNLLQVQKGQYVEIWLEIWRYNSLSGVPCADEEYIEIRDDHNQSANLLGVYCGYHVTAIRRSSGQSLWLNFTHPDRYYYSSGSNYSGKALNETAEPNLNLVSETQFVLLNHSSSLWCPSEGGPAPYIVWRKNGVIVQNSTSVRYRLTITDKENESNYSCEVNAHGRRDQKKISLVIE
ncbi:Bone morphogenetic protein 1, partial [Stylophora pistillata]